MELEKSEWLSFVDRMPWIAMGVNRGFFSLSDSSRVITYEAVGKSYQLTDPEEWVRANYYFELIDTYRYDVDHLDVEVPVPARVPNFFADIVVYSNARENPFAVVECKRDGISDNEFDQAIEQMFGNTNSLRAKYGATVAGNTRRFFDVGGFTQKERYKNIIADIPVAYGEVEQYRYKKGHPQWALKPVDKNSLIRSLGKCHSTIWDGGKMDPTEAFDELSKLVFVKMQDENLARLDGDPYNFQIGTKETPASVSGRINDLYKQARNSDPEIFDAKLVSPPEKIFTVVTHLQGIDLLKTDLDTKGVAFEKFMEDFFKGKQGQYFTPREIVSFTVKMCDIDNQTSILDPACGSGGFLLHALNEVREKANTYYDPNSVENFKYWHEFAANNLYGIDVNERIARVAKMNMIIHDDGHTNVICHDSLENIEEISQVNRGFMRNRFDLILTNPPFGAKIKQDEKPYLPEYELGKKADGSVYDSRASEILFIERCWQFLKPGSGKLAIVLPDGILTNHTLRNVRKFLLDKFELTAIISLPQVTFVHYGAGLKSSVLFLRKRDDGEEVVDNKVFCAVVSNVGFDSTGRKTANDLPEVLSKLQLYTSSPEEFKNEHHVFVKSISEFNKNRLDPYYYSPMFDEIESELKGSKFELKQLSDVCVKKGIFAGHTPKKESYTDNEFDPKIIKVSSLKSGRVNSDFFHHVTKKDFEEIKKKGKLVKNGDVFILASAHQSSYVGKNPCILELPDDHDEVVFVAELICIRANPDIVNPYYLLQLLDTETFYLLLNREKRGQSSHLYPRDLKSIEIPVPDPELQNSNASLYKTKYENYRFHTQEAQKILKDVSLEFKESFFGASKETEE